MTKHTPMIEQYLEIKSHHQDEILFFRLGDFYEMFFSDAELASRVLEIVLTARDGGGNQKVPMCGVPYHAASNYIAKLIAAGYKIAICEQVEDPSEAKGIVKREVTRIITPGTVYDEALLNEETNNYLAAIIQNAGVIGLAYMDVSTGEFKFMEFPAQNGQDEFQNEIEKISPKECLLPSWNQAAGLWANLDLKISPVISGQHLPEMDAAAALTCIESVFGTIIDEYINNKSSAGLIAAAMIVTFLNETQKTSISHLNHPVMILPSSFLEIDYSSRRNLELVSNLRENKRSGTLIEVLDKCNTSMGKRLLKSWLERPLKNPKLIQERLNAVAELFESINLRYEIENYLHDIYDLSRLAGRLGSGMASPRDLIAVKKSLAILPSLNQALQKVQSDLLLTLKNLDTMLDLHEILEAAIAEDAPLSIKEGSIVKSGYNMGIDELRDISVNGSKWLIEFETKERQRTGIKSLKIGYNRVFGYYIEISRAAHSEVPASYHRKQTLANTERYINEELKEFESRILSARERLNTLEYDEYLKIRATAEEYIPRLQEVAQRIAQLDVLNSFAKAAIENDYIKPLINDDGTLEIIGGRHPVVEKNLSQWSFIPNDVYLDKKNFFALITGPNMGGKSTFMRQIALITIMAQVGSFVPAKQARIGIVDRIFTRVGAADDLASGQSTFMVEMMEVANILKYASGNSLLILDEIGRGTSTFDGLSIARAVCEHIIKNIRAKTLFATHYHELTDMNKFKSGIFNLSLSVKETEEGIVFLRKVMPGRADKSYGIQVAKLAGLPKSVIRRAETVLDSLEQVPMAANAEISIQKDLFENINLRIVEELVSLDLDNLTPKNCGEILRKWQDSLKNDD